MEVHARHLRKSELMNSLVVGSRVSVNRLFNRNRGWLTGQSLRVGMVWVLQTFTPCRFDSCPVNFK